MYKSRHSEVLIPVLPSQSSSHSLTLLAELLFCPAAAAAVAGGVECSRDTGGVAGWGRGGCGQWRR